MSWLTSFEYVVAPSDVNMSMPTTPDPFCCRRTYLHREPGAGQSTCYSVSASVPRGINRWPSPRLTHFLYVTTSSLGLQHEKARRRLTRETLHASPHCVARPHLTWNRRHSEIACPALRRSSKACPSRTTRCKRRSHLDARRGGSGTRAGLGIHVRGTLRLHPARRATITFVCVRPTTHAVRATAARPRTPRTLRWIRRGVDEVGEW